MFLFWVYLKYFWLRLVTQSYTRFVKSTGSCSQKFIGTLQIFNLVLAHMFCEQLHKNGNVCIHTQ